MRQPLLTQIQTNSYKYSAQLCAGESFEVTRWGEDFMGQITPLWMLRQLPNMPACHISIEHNAQGPNNTITSQDSSALLALSEAMRWIKRGAVDCMVVGACTSNINPVDLSRKNLIDLLSRDEDPKRACRPFDRDRNGTILGEGAAAFVVENYEHAVRRGADIYAEVIGLGAGCDGHTLSDTTQQNDTGLVRAIESAMKQANLMPRELGHINAHGKSTKIDDQVEARAYHRLFGDDAVRPDNDPCQTEKPFIQTVTDVQSFRPRYDYFCAFQLHLFASWAGLHLRCASEGWKHSISVRLHPQISRPGMVG